MDWERFDVQVEVVEMVIDAVGEKTGDGCSILHSGGTQYYGKGYGDIRCRVPSIRRAQNLLGWMPRIGIRESIERIVEYDFREGWLAESA